MTEATSSPVEQPTQVVVDTSVIRQGEGDLSRGDWPTLKAAARLGLITIHLPAPVLKELVDHRKRDLRKWAKAEADVRAMRRVFFPVRSEFSRLSCGPSPWLRKQLRLTRRN